MNVSKERVLERFQPSLTILIATIIIVLSFLSLIATLSPGFSHFKNTASRCLFLLDILLANAAIFVTLLSREMHQSGIRLTSRAILDSLHDPSGSTKGSK
ncbi:MAG: hypothetical protein HZC26_03130 [Candidatus Magasanikbacteria bacterium]|nr:hypothetical protein [Candidatus Magasanikbacteria bacterium]